MIDKRKSGILCATVTFGIFEDSEIAEELRTHELEDLSRSLLKNINTLLTNERRPLVLFPLPTEHRRINAFEEEYIARYIVALAEFKDAQIGEEVWWRVPKNNVLSPVFEMADFRFQRVNEYVVSRIA